MKKWIVVNIQILSFIKLPVAKHVLSLLSIQCPKIMCRKVFFKFLVYVEGFTVCNPSITIHPHQTTTDAPNFSIKDINRILCNTTQYCYATNENKIEDVHNC